MPDIVDNISINLFWFIDHLTQVTFVFEKIFLDSRNGLNSMNSFISVHFTGS